MCRSLDELIKSRSVHLNQLALWTSIIILSRKNTLNMNLRSASLLMNDTDVRFITAHIHTEARDARSDFSVCRSLNEDINNEQHPRTARRVTS